MPSRSRLMASAMAIDDAAPISLNFWKLRLRLRNWMNISLAAWKALKGLDQCAIEFPKN